MNRHLARYLAALILLGGVARNFGQAPLATGPERSPFLQALLDSAVSLTLQQHAPIQLHSNQLAVTLVDLRDPLRLAQASYRGNEQVYPASVVKLFYLVATHRWLEDGKLQDTDELRRALRDMIVDSSNEATHYVLDLLTGTTSGPELPPAELEEWFYRRNAINRYFTSLGYTNINANRKPWCEGPYGREMQSVKTQKPGRNMLTTDATARLLTDIVIGKAVTAARSAEMMKLLERNPLKGIRAGCEPHQDVDFTAPGLPPGARYWAKAGWTSETRHDAAYLELPSGLKCVLVTFTTDHANAREIIPTVARKIIEGLK